MAADEPNPPASQPVSREAIEALKAKLEDFDDPDKFKRLLERAVAECAYNFVVQFGDKKAQIAVDLNVPSLETFLKRQDPEYPVRWM